MSGITATRVVVIAPAELERRQRLAAWEEYAAARAELTALRAEADTYRSLYGDAVRTVPGGARLRPSASVRKLQAATEEIRRLLDRHRPLLREDVATAASKQASRLVAAAPAARPGPLSAPRSRALAAEQSQPAGPVAGEPADHWREKVTTRVGELLARLPAGTDPAARTACERAVVEIGTATEVRARMLLADLERRVRRATDAAERRDSVRRELAALAAVLEAAVDAPSGVVRELTAAVEEAMVAVEPRLPDGLAERVVAVVEEAEREHRRRVIAAAVSVSLGELEYTVTEGFETVLADQGVAYANLPNAAGYGVKFLLDRDDRTVRTQVVRTAENGAEADAAAERTFCAGLPDLLSRLRRHGVEPEQVSTVDPGTVAVLQVPSVAVPDAAATGARAYAARQERQREA